MNDHIRKAGQFLDETVSESLRHANKDHGESMYQQGFTGATAITLRTLQQRIDGFKERMKGPGLTKTEQAVFAELDGLKSEIEADCDRYWRGSGVDWRPMQPVAKRAFRRSDDAGSGGTTAS